MKYRMIIALAAVAFGFEATAAQDFPVRNVTIVVPYAAGGATDISARAVGEHMSATLGQRFVTENVTGGGGTLAITRVTRSPGDGYTLLVNQLALAASASLFPNAPFDVEKDLVGVGLINYSPMMLVGRKSLPANSIRELISWMRQPGVRPTFVHVGAGSAAHLCAALFAHSIGIDVNMIPYRGAAQALPDLIAGNVDLYCTPPSGPAEYVRAGTMKGYGIFSQYPVVSLPELPSLVAQLGVPELEIRFWQGMFAPSRTPRPILEKLNAALRLALNDPKVLKTFDPIDFDVFPKEERTSASADHLLHAEVSRWRDVVRTNHIQAEAP
jgi:putative tricarboxylic transport membrane protein